MRFLSGKIFFEKAEYLIAGAVVLLYFVVNLNIEGPVIQGDEGGYLSNAAALTGYWVDAASSYFAGYSLFLVPAFLVGGDPLRVFFFVKLINALLWGATSLVVYCLLRNVSPLEEKKNLLGAVALSMLYPAWINFTGYAMSENAFVFVFCLGVLLAVKVTKTGGLFWLLWAFSVAFLFFIHPKALPVLAAAFLAAFLTAKKRNEWAYFFVFSLIVIGLVLFYKYLFEPWLVAGMSTSAYSPKLHYPGAKRFLSLLTDQRKLRQIPGRFFGHLMYLGFSTLGIIFLPFSRNIMLRKRKITEADPALIYALLAFLGTLVMSVVFVASANASRFDHWMYGRYTEGVMLPVLALGCLYFRRKTPFFGIVLSVIMLILFLLTKNPTSGMMRLNISALWPTVNVLIQSKFAVCFFAFFLLVFCFWGRAFTTRTVCVVLFFALNALNQVEANVRDYRGGGQRWSLYKEIRKSFPAGSCVGLDPSIPRSPLNITFYPGYFFYLYDYDIKKMSLEEWLKSCNGPYISFDRRISSFTSGVLPLAEELFDGPVAFMKEKGGSTHLYAFSVSNNRAYFLLFLSEGWYRAEKSSVWSGKEAKLIIPQRLVPLEKEFRNLLLVFRVFNASKKNPKEVFFSINGEEEQEIFTSSGVVTKRFTLPSDVLENTKDIFLTLSVPKAESPQSIGMSADRRVLGVSLQRVAFVK